MNTWIIIVICKIYYNKKSLISINNITNKLTIYIDNIMNNCIHHASNNTVMTNKNNSFIFLSSF